MNLPVTPGPVRLLPLLPVVLLAASILMGAWKADRGEPIEATVVGIGPGGVAEMEIEGSGTFPATWVSDPVVGDRVGVRVVGERVAPAPLVERPLALWLAACLAASAAAVAVAVVRDRGLGVPDRASQRAAVRGGPRQLVRAGRIGLEVHGGRPAAWVEVLDASTGASLGSV